MCVTRTRLLQALSSSSRESDSILTGRRFTSSDTSFAQHVWDPPVQARCRSRARRTREFEMCRYDPGCTTCLRNIYAPLISPYRRGGRRAASGWRSRRRRLVQPGCLLSLSRPSPTPPKNPPKLSDPHKRTGEGARRCTLAAFCTFKSNYASRCRRERRVATPLFTFADNIFISGIIPP